jgi:hypothetical protein
MKTLVSILAVTLARAFTGPAFAGDVITAKTAADCAKAGCIWNGVVSLFRTGTGFACADPVQGTWRAYCQIQRTHIGCAQLVGLAKLCGELPYDPDNQTTLTTSIGYQL